MWCVRSSISIIGTGSVDSCAYLDVLYELGIEETCRCAGVLCTAGIEMGAAAGLGPDEPEQWIAQSVGDALQICSQRPCSVRWQLFRRRNTPITQPHDPLSIDSRFVVVRDHHNCLTSVMELG